MAKYLDINGVKTLKYYFEKLVESKGAADSDIDNGVINAGDGGNGFVTVRNLAYYHNKLLQSQKKTVESIVVDALSNNESESKSQIYSSVEAIVDKKMNETMTWNTKYPENI